MLSKPLLWTMRVLAVSAFIGVLAWQVVRRQAAANPPPESGQMPAETHVPGSKSAPVEWEQGEEEKLAQPPVFLSGSKSFTGSVQVDGGTLVLPAEKPREVDTYERLRLLDPDRSHWKMPATKSAPVVLPRELPKTTPAAPQEKLTQPDWKPMPAPGGIIDVTGKSAGLILPREIKPSPDAPAPKP